MTDQMSRVRGLSPALQLLSSTQLVVVRSGGRGGRGASVLVASSGGAGEGSGKLLWAGFMTGGVIMRG